MAESWKNSKENQSCWIFKDAMVEHFIETLEASRIEYGSIKGRGFDFEGGLVKSYSELRKTMSEK